MKTVILCTLMFVGCRGHKPMFLPDGSYGYATKCRDSWSVCYIKASRICKGEYKVLEKDGAGFVTGDFSVTSSSEDKIRTLFFTCKQ